MSSTYLKVLLDFDIMVCYNQENKAVIKIYIDKIYTKADILCQIDKLNIPKGSIVLAHTAYRLIGKVDGGAKTVLDALIEYFTENGGLFCVPTHTWASIKEPIILDMNENKTCLGAFSDYAASDERGIRSLNPSHSMMVFGDRKRALEFIKDDAFVTSGTAPESCYGKLYSMGGYVLLVGVAQNRNTYIHAVEEMLKIPNRMAEKPDKTIIKRLSGEMVKRDIWLYQADFVEDVSWRFVKYDTPFRYHGCIVDGFIGNAPVQLCNARKMKETVELIFNNSAGVDVLADELPIEQKFYCNKN